MGRPLRLQSPSLQYHIQLLCNAPEFRFEEDADYSYFLETLRFVRRKHRFKLFNFEFLPERVHLFLQPSPQISLARTMQLLNWKFARDLNRVKGRRGQFWKHRYQSTAVEPGAPAMAVMRAINRSALREGLAKRPGEWAWSAYSVLALGAADELITPHPSYLRMAEDEETRRRAYAEWVLGETSAEFDPFKAKPIFGSKAFFQRCQSFGAKPVTEE